MPTLGNNFNNISGNASNIGSNVTSIGGQIGKMKSPKNIGSASLQLANSAVNLAGSVVGIFNSVNGLFNVDRDVIRQDVNKMRGNHYISGYERLPVPPLPPIDPFSPPNILEPFLPPDVNDVLGLTQSAQQLVEYDMENFKYSMQRISDETDSFYEDPLYLSFDLMFDRTVSPLFNGEIDKFFEVYGTNTLLLKAWWHYKKFVELFFKIFNGIGPQKYVSQQILLPGSSFGNTIGKNISIPENYDNKRNKVWYINKISGLDKLSAKIPKYEEDKLTITLSEDVAMLVNYMVDSYNNFIYCYSQQRYNLPDNLLRFKMMIRLSDLRTMKLINHFENPDYMYDKASQIYTLYDCNFNFFNSKNFGDEVVNGGYGGGKQDTPSTVSFDIIYKSIQKEFRTPLIKGEKDTVVDNKNTEDYVGSMSLMNIFREKMGRTDEIEMTLKDILSGAFGAATSLNNMLTNYIPKFQPPIPNIPSDLLGSVYDNINNIGDQYGRNGGVTVPPSETDNLHLADLEYDDPLQSRRDLINKFTQEMIGLIPPRILPSESRPKNETPPTNINNFIPPPKPPHGDLGYIFDKIPIPKPNILPPTNVIYSIPQPRPHGNLGFISLFLNQSNTGNLGFDYQNVGYLFNGDLGDDYVNIGNRAPLDNIVLFGEGNVPTPSLGSVYTNIFELRNVNLNTLFDNSVSRQQIPLGELYSNLSEMNTNDLGDDFNNNVEKTVTTDIPNVYINETTERIVNLSNLYDKTVKPEMTPLSNVYENIGERQVLPLSNDYDNVGEKQVLPESVLFNKTEKPEMAPLSNDYENIGERQVLPESILFNGTEKPDVELDSVYINQSNKTVIDLNNVYSNELGEKKYEDIGTLFDGTKKPETQDLGKDFSNDGTKENVHLDSVYHNIVPDDLLYSTASKKHITSDDVYHDLVVYNNTIERNNKLQLDSVYHNIIPELTIEKLLLGVDINTPPEKSKEDLGESYENNLIDE